MKQIGAVILGLMLLGQSGAAGARSAPRESGVTEVVYGVDSVLATPVYLFNKAGL